jgi:hypothetical protein
MHLFPNFMVCNFHTPIPLLTCLLKHITEGKIEGMGRQGRRCKQLLDNLKEMRRY